MTRCATLLFFCLYASYLALWATLYPPEMGPDEGSHLHRCLALQEHPLSCDTTHPLIPSESANPFADQPLLAHMMLNSSKKLTPSDVRELKNLPWRPAGHKVPAYTYHHKHAPLYYWIVHFPASGLTKLFSLSPWNSYLAYRLVSAFYAALLWTLALRAALVAFPFRGVLAFMFTIIFNPMVVFVGSSINNDALTLPLAALILCHGVLYLRGKRGLQGVVTGLLLFAAMKASALPFALALGLGMGVAGCLESDTKRRQLWSLGAASMGACLVSWIVYYSWNPPYFMGQASEDDLEAYLVKLPQGMSFLFVHYWGSLGWQDCHLPEWGYKAIAAVSVFLTALGALRLRRLSRWIFRSLCVSALCLTLVLFAGEYSRLHISGYVLSGRYWLILALALNLMFLNRNRWIQAAVVAGMIAMNLYFIGAIQERYYL